LSTPGFLIYHYRLSLCLSNYPGHGLTSLFLSVGIFHKKSGPRAALVNEVRPQVTFAGLLQLRWLLTGEIRLDGGQRRSRKATCPRGVRVPGFLRYQDENTARSTPPGFNEISYCLIMPFLQDGVKQKMTESWK
jgi:hypothetical protein